MATFNLRSRVIPKNSSMVQTGNSDKGKNTVSTDHTQMVYTATETEGVEEISFGSTSLPMQQDNLNRRTPTGFDTDEEDTLPPSKANTKTINDK